MIARSGSSRCSTPEKEAFTSAGSAHRAASSMGNGRRGGGTGGKVHTYRCECGSWHVTSARVRVTKQFRERRNG